MPFNPDCQPEKFPCWQHYAEHHNCQPPTKWVLDLAAALVDFRLRELRLHPKGDTAFNVYIAAHMLHDLYNARWRFIHFEPFLWPVGKSKDTFIPETASEKVAARSFLEQLGFTLPPPPAPFPRRI